MRKIQKINLEQKKKKKKKKIKKKIQNYFKF